MSPFEENTPSELPVPAFNIPLTNTVPSVVFVIVSSFCKIKPAAPVISTFEEAVISVPDIFPVTPRSPLSEVVVAFTKIVPSVVFVIVSSFCKIKPAAPVISTFEEAVISVPDIVVNAPVDGELAPMEVPSIAPELRSTLPLADKVVNAPVDGELSPMGVVLIDPPLIVKSLATFASATGVPVVRTVPLSFGKVIVLSEVGSVTANVVSYGSSVSPSRINGSAPVKVPIVFASIPVKLDPSPKNCVAVTSPATVTAPVPSVIRSLSLIWPM